MTSWNITGHQLPYRGTLQVPGDKSISHRAIMFGAAAQGTTTVENFLTGEDCLHTVSIFQQLGVKIDVEGTNVLIQSEGFHAWKRPHAPLDAGNSGTTARLLLGLLAPSTIEAEITGDRYLRARPMNRIVDPLRQMNASIEGKTDQLPLTVRGRSLRPIVYHPPVASAQVKSAVLLAGLHTEGTTTVIERAKTRDHTERLLEDFGVFVKEDGLSVSIDGPVQLEATKVIVPGDISSAAFFLVGAAITPGSDLTLQRVGLNETRTGIIDVLRAMGADLEISNVSTTGETYGDIRIQYAPLRAITLDDEALIPRLIDELPLIALLATQAEGTTTIRNAEELRVKETDRIEAVVNVLRTFGANISPLDDGFHIEGKTSLTGGVVDTYGDHRIGMMAAIAAKRATGETTITNPSCIAISYPQFAKDLETIQ